MHGHDQFMMRVQRIMEECVMETLSSQFWHQCCGARGKELEALNSRWADGVDSFGVWGKILSWACYCLLVVSLGMYWYVVRQSESFIYLPCYPYLDYSSNIEIASSKF